jgi:hypothetical protein
LFSNFAEEKQRINDTVLNEQQNVWKLVPCVFGEGKMCELRILH